MERLPLEMIVQAGETTSQENEQVLTTLDLLSGLVVVLIVIIVLLAAVLGYRAIRTWVWVDEQRSHGGSDGTSTSSPLSYRLVITAVTSVAAIFVLTMLLFWVARSLGGRPLFNDAAQVIAALSLVFTVIGTLVGTYFGIKTSSDSQDAATEVARKAQEAAHSATQNAQNIAGRLAASQGASYEEDYLSIITSFHSAWNAGDEERVVGLFADDANVRLATLPPGESSAYTGKEQARTFVQKYMPGSKIDSRNHRRTGESEITWESTVTWEDLRQASGGTGPTNEAETTEGTEPTEEGEATERTESAGATEEAGQTGAPSPARRLRNTLQQLGINTVEGTAEAAFRGGSIGSFTFTLSPATQQIVYPALQSGTTQRTNGGEPGEQEGESGGSQANPPDAS